MPERRFQRDPDGPDRTSQRRDAERCPLSGEAPRLAVERLVLTEFLIDDQPVGWAGESARDDVERRGILVDCLAIATDEFLPDILDHLMSARKALQRLGDRLSKLCKPRPAAARAGIWPWQIDALALRHAVYGLRSTVYGLRPDKLSAVQLLGVKQQADAVMLGRLEQRAATPTEEINVPPRMDLGRTPPVPAAQAPHATAHIGMTRRQPHYIRTPDAIGSSAQYCQSRGAAVPTRAPARTHTRSGNTISIRPISALRGCSCYAGGTSGAQSAVGITLVRDRTPAAAANIDTG
jgi:hypothetical protein